MTNEVPLSSPAADGFDPYRRRGAGQRVLSSTRAKPLILVVEDSAIVVDQYRYWLETTYQIEDIGHGRGALGKIMRLRPALIILDWQLVAPPDAPSARPMSGRDVLAAIKRSPLRNIPVMMLTSRDGIFDHLGAKIARADAYLTKPVKEDELRRTIQRLLAVARPVEGVPSLGGF
ncbi:MAG TPA: response regulator [Chloroflexota bacterium]|nr:response regulator [Chloroflexota bacterium]